MREMMQLNNPSLISLLFFSENALSKSPGDRPEQWLADRLKLERDPNQSGNNGSYALLNDGFDIEIESCIAHDTLILRLCLSIVEPHALDCWQSLVEAWSALQHDYLSEGYDVQPWGLTRLFHASVVGRGSSAGLVDQKQALDGLLGLTPSADPPDTTSYGWFWMIKEAFEALDNGHRFWGRDLLLLTPEDRSERVNTYFLQPLGSGFSRIELYLQKSKHHARQGEIGRDRLSQSVETLQKEMVRQLGSLDFSQIHQEPVDMEKLSRFFLIFLAQKAAEELLLNSIKNNHKAFIEHLDHVKLETNIYSLESHVIAHEIEQIESDLYNVRVMQESTYAFQDIQRSTEASRFERASYLMGGSAALLAAISLHSSFMQIWSLALENSTWIIPPGWIRVILSLIASITIPMAAAWLISRRKTLAIMTGTISLLTILAMILSTVLVNL
jgi:hypothetical protein